MVALRHGAKGVERRQPPLKRADAIERVVEGEVHASPQG